MIYKKKQLISCLIASLIFFFDFLQMNILNTCGKYFIAKFSLSPIEYGWFSSLYFYCMLPMFLLAGILLDKYNVRSIIICVAGIYMISSGVLAFTNDFIIACCCRGLSGACGGFCLLSVIVLICKYFGKDNISFLSGITVTIGMCGGVCAQTPLEIALKKIGFSNSLMLNFAIAFVIFIMTFSIENDFIYCKHEVAKKKRITLQNFIGITKFGICAGLLFVPVSSLCGFFGIEYCTSCYHVTRTAASVATGLIFIGMIVGSPFWGAFGDNKKSLIFGNLLALLCLVLLIKSFYVNLCLLYLEKFILGFACASQVIVFSIISHSSCPNSIGTYEGVVSTVIMLMSAITQSCLSIVFGKLEISNAIFVLIMIIMINLLQSLCFFKEK